MSANTDAFWTLLVFNFIRAFTIISAAISVAAGGIIFKKFLSGRREIIYFLLFVTMRILVAAFLGITEIPINLIENQLKKRFYLLRGINHRFFRGILLGMIGFGALSDLNQTNAARLLEKLYQFISFAGWFSVAVGILNMVPGEVIGRLRLANGKQQNVEASASAPAPAAVASGGAPPPVPQTEEEKQKAEEEAKKTEKENTEKAEKENTEKAEKENTEKAEKENAEKAKTEKENAEKAEQENAEKAKKEKEERRKRREEKKAQSRQKGDQGQGGSSGKGDNGNGKDGKGDKNSKGSKRKGKGKS